ncbi:hypothetical protein HZB00_02175 [Candidatus Woesearchaeota archaeon]|nr:hypothetical protein [Candidatus Woesearchaeota archaeon]
MKSGRQSHWYVNWRTVAESARGMRHVAEYVLAFALDQQLKPDCFYGVPEGATKLGLFVQDRWANDYLIKEKLDRDQLPMGRGKSKEHGDPKDRYFLGTPRGDVVMVEDVTTTGDSLLTEIQKVRSADANVVVAIGLTNRMERRDDGKSVVEALQAEGVPYFFMSSALELLPRVYQRSPPSDRVAREVEKEFGQYGLEKLALVKAA